MHTCASNAHTRRNPLGIRDRLRDLFPSRASLSFPFPTLSLRPATPLSFPFSSASSPVLSHFAPRTGLVPCYFWSLSHTESMWQFSWNEWRGWWGRPLILRDLLTQPTRSFAPLCTTPAWSFESLIELYSRRREWRRWIWRSRPRPTVESRGEEWNIVRKSW